MAGFQVKQQERHLFWRFLTMEANEVMNQNSLPETMGSNSFLVGNHGFKINFRICSKSKENTLMKRVMMKERE